MASELPNVPANDYVKARLALWAGDREFLHKFLNSFSDQTDDQSVLPLKKARSFDEIIRANVQSMKRSLRRVENFLEQSTLISEGYPENPYVTSPNGGLRGVIYEDGMGQYSMRAYLTALQLEREFFTKVSRIAGTQRPATGTDEERLIPTRSRQWFNQDTIPFVLIQVAELAIVYCKANWGSPQEDVDQVRERFLKVLESFDPVV